MMDSVESLVRPSWPPLRHVHRGWDALTGEERQEVKDRVAAVLERHSWSDHDRGALRRFFSFLAQVETIAIEIPLRFLESAPEALRPQLRHQLVDEVFHSVLFARLAFDLSDGEPPRPIESAERLLDRIREEKDLAVSATLLNLVAEGWIETLFQHAATWGVAPAVFETVLEDESRHVAEALDYTDTLDAEKAAGAVHAFEDGLVAVSLEPDVAAALVHVAGPEGHRALVRDLHDGHRRHLAEVGLEPSPAWQRLDEYRLRMEALQAELEGDVEVEMATPVPDTPWRRAARMVWDTPRDPTMQGEFTVAVGHVPRKLLTPVIVAALGRAWAKNPRLNRILAQGRVWQLPKANVGVRVLVAEDELATVVITDADQRSVRDIARMIQDGAAQLRALRQHQAELPERPFDPEAGAWLPPGAGHFSVALSNPGKFGIVSGAGAFSGHVSPSTDITVGRRRRMPKWRGVAYLPAWHVSFGALQDHRLFDGAEAGLAMDALQEQLSRKGVRAIRKTSDTIPDGPPAEYDAGWAAALPPELQMVSAVGLAKYVPLVIGGLGIGAGIGIGGYYLFNALSAANAAAATQSAAGAAGAAGTATGAAVKHVTLVPFTDTGLPRCQAITQAGAQCANAASAGENCGTHRPAGQNET